MSEDTRKAGFNQLPSLASDLMKLANSEAMKAMIASAMPILEAQRSHVKSVDLFKSQRDANQRKQVIEKLEIEHLKLQNEILKQHLTETTKPPQSPSPPVSEIAQPQSDEGRRERQIAAICEVTKSLGYNPLKIPEGGKAKIKAKCLQLEGGLFTDSGFAHAWKAANKSEKIRMQDKEKFLSKQ